MKLYCITYYDDPRKRDRSEWHGTQAQRNQRMAQLRKSIEAYDVIDHEVEVPTDKAGLLQFLNDREVRP